MKNALVVSGGGSKGAFAVGAVEVLREKGITFDIVTGTSTGALLAPFVVIDEIQVLRSLYTSIRTEDIIRKRNLFDILTHDSIYDSNPLWSLLNAVITQDRYRKIIDSSIELYVTTVNLQTGQIEYWNQHQSGPIGSPSSNEPLGYQAFLRAVFASASEPVLMPNVRINAEGNQYTDGGVREFAPLKIAIDNGATRIYAIVLRPEEREPKGKTYDFIVKTLQRTINLFVEEVAVNDVNQAVLYNKATRYLEEARKKAESMLTASQIKAIFDDPANPNPFADKKVLELHIIRPSDNLPTAGLEFRPFIMAQMMEMGREAAEKVLSEGPLVEKI
jgi:predicted acylesterase/phospholipase RssA